MKLSLKWLAQYVKLAINTDKIAHQLTDSGLEVEAVVGDVIEISVPPNRADCLSVIGVARELAALNAQQFSLPVVKPVPKKITDQMPIDNQAPQACPKYLSRVIKNVNNTKTSPQWLQDALIAAEMKIISPIVDITNYVMLEWGQPVHAFDLSKVDRKIVIRMAKANEELVLLDDSTIKLNKDSLVIADQSKPLALAGIKGGKDSGISLDTKDILLECAYFEPVGIRLTSRTQKVQSDSSYRNERGIDPQMQANVMERLTELVLEIVGGEPGPVEIVANAKYIPQRSKISLRLERIKKILGIEIDLARVKNILTSLGMLVNDKDTSTLEVEPPSFRTDIEREIDLIEEVVRIYGYNNVPSTPTTGTLRFIPLSEATVGEQEIVNCLVNRGYYQGILYSFIEPEYAKQFSPEIKNEMLLTNPISSEMALMRPSLLPGLLKALDYNLNRQHNRIRLFEVGLRFLGQNADQQIKTIAGVCTGDYLPESWGNAKRFVDLYDLKSDVLALFKLANLDTKIEFQTTHDPALHPGQACEVLLAGKPIGKIGMLHPQIQQTLAISQPVCMFEIDYMAVANGRIPNFVEFSKYPAVRRDLAILVDRDLVADRLTQGIRQQVGKLLKNLVIFDVYQGKGVPENKQSVGLAITLQDLERTLTDPEINTIFDDLIGYLNKEFAAILR